MNIKELLNEVDNPLNDNKIMEKLLKAYANTTIKEEYYSKLIYSNPKNENELEINENDYNDFQVEMFNKWLNNTLDLPLSNYYGSNITSLLTLKSHLRELKKVNSINEINNFINNAKDNAELFNALDMFYWDNLTSKTTWTYLTSSFFKTPTNPYTIEDRLYINSNPSDTYKLLNLLIKEFDINNLDYCLKFTTDSNRDDSIVIYSSSKDLEKYVAILEKISKENKELITKLNNPPILTGQIYNWLGYGCEPMDHLLSYSTIRAHLMYDAITNATHKWLLENQDTKIKYRRKVMTFKEYFKIQVVKYYMDKLANKYDEKYQIFKEETKQYLGYSKEEITDINYILSVAKSININPFFAYLKNKNNYFKELFKINLPDGKIEYIDAFSLTTIIHKISQIIYSHNNDFSTLIKEEARKLANEYNIDSKTLYLDTYKINTQNKNISLK